MRPDGTLAAVICSPPYADSFNQGGDQATNPGMKWNKGERKDRGRVNRANFRGINYGHTPGQVGALKSGDLMTATTAADCELLSWTGCYEDNWDGIICPEAFAHPAKMARGLLTRILAHGFERGYWRRGDVIGDPFGGVGTTGLLVASKGMRCVSVELEPRFVRMATSWHCPGVAADEWLRFRHRWPRSPMWSLLCPACQQGPPPYRGDGRIPRVEPHAYVGNYELHRQVWERCGDPLPVIVQGDSRNFAEIIRGQLAACVTSPPYATGDTAGPESLARRKDSSAAAMLKAQGWGVGGQVSEGNVASLPAGNVGAVITSPPYADSAGNGTHGIDWTKHKQRTGEPSTTVSPGSFGVANGYGTAPGQVGITSGESYWSAMRTIYGQVFQALKSGGVLCCVLKNYVAKKRVVPLTDQTAALLQHLGFRVVTRVRAMLVKETRGADLFGGQWVEKVGRKSFFRRLYEKKYPENAIDWEDVIIAQKP